MRLIIILFTLFIALNLSAQKEELLKFLPDETEYQDYQLKEEPIYYENDDLFFLINGGADIYLEYGFNNVISATYTSKSNLELKAEIYQMKNDSAVYGIFTFNKGNRLVSDDIGDACIIQNDFLIFIKGSYYVVLTTRSNKDKEEAVNLQEFAQIIDTKIKAIGKLPELVASYRQLTPGAIYILGNLALSNNYLFDYSDIFGFKEAIISKDVDAMRFVFMYETEEATEKAFQSAKENLESSARFTSFNANENSFQMNDKKGNSLLFVPHRNRILIAIGKNEKNLEEQINRLKISR